MLLEQCMCPWSMNGKSQHWITHCYCFFDNGATLMAMQDQPASCRLNSCVLPQTKLKNIPDVLVTSRQTKTLNNIHVTCLHNQCETVKMHAQAPKNRNETFSSFKPTFYKNIQHLYVKMTTYIHSINQSINQSR
jgi:hypothetical protein